MQNFQQQQINAMQSFHQQQIKVMTEQHREQHREEMASREQSYRRQAEQHREEMARLIAQLAPGQVSAPVTPPPVAVTTPSFAAFDPTIELWKDYWARFQICMEAN